MSYAIKLGDNAGSRALLAQAVDQRMLDGAALGIAQRVLADGLETVSEKQLGLLNAAIYAAGIRQAVCSCCDDLIPLDEVLNAEDGLCSRCQYREDKDKRLVREAEAAKSPERGGL
jgi:hypothetical protein